MKYFHASAMSALTSLLARDRVVPVRKIEEALQKQVVSGGEISSILLELDVIPENTLAAYCAALYGLRPATRDEVMGAAHDAIHLVPREIAEKHRLVPLAVSGGKLVVAMAHPLVPEVAEQLGSLLGYELVVRIACDVRVSAGLAHHYGSPVPPRHARLAERLRERDPGPIPCVEPPQSGPLDPRTRSELPAERPSVADFLDDDDEEEEREVASLQPPGHTSPFPRTPEGAAIARARRRTNTARFGVPPQPSPPPVPSLDAVCQGDDLPAPPSTHPPSAASTSPVIGVGTAVSETLRRATPSMPATSSSASRAVRDRDLRGSGRTPRRVRGPLTAAAATKLLDEATDRDDVLEIFFAFARQFFDYAALFVVHGEVADGFDAFGSGASSEAVRQLAIPLDRPGVFAEAKRTLQAGIGTLGTTATDREIAARLLRDPSAPALVLPVAIRGRAVLLFLGHREGEAFELSDLPELWTFVPHVVAAIERLILLRKRGAGSFDRVLDRNEERERLEQPTRSAAFASPTTLAREASLTADAAVVCAANAGGDMPRVHEVLAALFEASRGGPGHAPHFHTIRRILGIPREAPPPPIAPTTVVQSSDGTPAPPEEAFPPSLTSLCKEGAAR